MEKWIGIIIEAILTAFGIAMFVTVFCFLIDIIFLHIGLIEPPLMKYIMLGTGGISFIVSLFFYYYNEY